MSTRSGPPTSGPAPNFSVQAKRATTILLAALGCTAAIALVLVVGVAWGDDAGRSAAADRRRVLLEALAVEVRSSANHLSARLEAANLSSMATPQDVLPGMLAYEVAYVAPRASATEVLDPALLAIERIEQEQGLESAALAAYRDLAADRSRPATVRAAALWNQARLERSNGRGHEARRLLEAAAGIAVQDDLTRLRIEFDLAMATGLRAALIEALEPRPAAAVPLGDGPAPAFGGVDPRGRAILHARLGGPPKGRRPLSMLDRLLSHGPGPIVPHLARLESESDAPQLGYLIEQRDDRTIVAVGEEAAVLQGLLPSLATGYARVATPGEFALQRAPLPRAIGLGDAATRDLQRSYDRAWWSRVRWVAGLGVALLSVGAWIAWIVRRQRAVSDRQRDFVAAVTHELKTPLSNILLYAETLREAGHDDPARVPSFARTIQDEAERLRQRIQQVLDVASGRRTVTPKDGTFDPAELAEAVAADYQKGALDRGMRIAVARAGDGPRIYGDPELLAQALGVLLDNAIRYAGHGTVSIVVRAASDRVSIRVRDQGPGILNGDRDRVFEPFVRLGAELTRANPGTGLGLGLARQCVEQLGGRLDLDDESGSGPGVSGASFRIRLPVAAEGDR